MCLAVLAIQAHRDFPFICISNRDEFHNRPTKPMHAWAFTESVLHAGQDLQSGGTWLGLGGNAEFSLLTNVRNSTLNMPSSAPSRGQLVVDAIQNGIGPSVEESIQYAGFNLIHGNLQTLNLKYISNQGLKLAGDIPFMTKLEEGIHSISNGYLNAQWPKSRRLKEDLTLEIEAFNTNATDITQFENSMFKLLSHTCLADDAELPSTGVPYEWEKMLSAIKIISPVYGTRSSAVILLDKHNRVHFTELTFDTAGNEIGRQRVEIPLPPKQ